METLRGIFPQTLPPPKRDFLKENVMKVKNMQRIRKPTKRDTEYSKFNKPLPPRPRKFSLCESNAPVASRSTNSLALCSTKPPMGNGNLRKSISTMSMHSQKRDFASQTVDPTDEYFLKDSIIRYPSASTVRSSNRPPSAHHHQPQTCSRGHQMEPEPEPPHRPRFRSHFHEKPDDYSDKMDRHISNLSEFLDRGSIAKKQPSSILKNSTVPLNQKNNKDRINESQKKEDRVELDTAISISDDEDDVQKEKNAPSEKELEMSEEKKKQLKAAEEDPDCPEGHFPLPENERLDALKLAKKRFKDLIDDLNRLPMTCETLRVRNRKIQIEKELRTLEINIRVFSRTKVYVKLGE